MCAIEYTAVLSDLIGKNFQLPWTNIFGSERRHVLENLKLKLALPMVLFLQLVRSCAGKIIVDWIQSVG